MGSIPWAEAQDPRTGILFMKVGTHANESLDEIITRKQKEIERAGFALWGYGGNTCHPTSMVQPFAQSLASRGSQLVLAMKPMESKHFAEPLRASEYSVDGLEWEAIPEAVNALGSRYALWIDSLEEADLELPLDMTKVGLGPSAGRAGDRYVKGRVDKACLEYDPTLMSEGTQVASIGLVAHMAEPYAVFLR
ncbi:hypothetical protein [Cellulomonas sp. NS3]|uniref:hypothetical protein n=1 Tax=Cellulomonas sp. NS3 TaxID=2973977 RepID=UPI0021614AB7|nr:hypothetical protein [Cellulomonas sp. NS3]